HGHTVPGEELGDEPDRKDVRVSVLLREPQSLGQVRPDDIAVQHLHLQLPFAKLVMEHLGERRLPCPRQAGEPHGEPLLFVTGHKKLLPCAPSGASRPYRERMVVAMSIRGRPARDPTGCAVDAGINSTPARSGLAPSGTVAF